MASVSGVSISTPKLIIAKASSSDSTKLPAQKINFPSLWNRGSRGRINFVRPVAAAPDKISEKVAESVKAAEELCASDPVSGECAAAWDEVEELSAAASHARDRKKGEDVLEEYCKDNPETDECRTYDN
ncbi:OLC1v1019733C2 [Oldenlandia corymbosa var. corymbosa]|nr:OLC1v1019733C2 [Oldenlandia corymbosa var. corymbosa]